MNFHIIHLNFHFIISDEKWKDSFNWNTSLDEGLEISSSNHTNYIEKAESQFNASDLDLLQQRQGEMAIEFTSSEDVQTLVHTSSEDFAKIPINQI